MPSCPLTSRNPRARPTHQLSLVSSLRRALAEASVIRQLPGGYRLSIVKADVDVYLRFADLAAQGRRELRAGAIKDAMVMLSALSS